LYCVLHSFCWLICDWLIIFFGFSPKKMNTNINRKCNHAHKTTSYGIGLKIIISGGWCNTFRATEWDHW
jgi:hypothetical protein